MNKKLYARHASRCGRFATGAAMALLLCAANSACKVTPDYASPNLKLPDQFKSPADATATSRLSADWWILFKDPQLTALEEAATRYNPDLQAAMERVIQARQAARSVASQFYPTITADPSITRTRSTGAPRSGSAQLNNIGRSTTSTEVQIPFDLSYEIDIWGRVARAVESANALTQATTADYFVIMQTLQADVAQNYFTLRSLDAQITILNRNVGLYRHQIDLLEIKRKAEFLAPVDMAQAQALLESTSASLIDTQRQRDDVEHALALLTGRTPSELSLPEGILPASKPAIPAGLPADLLRRRPDVAEAEQNLRSANADVGERIAEFYPKVSLTGSAGFESFDLAHAVDWESRVFSIGPSVFIPLFEGGRLDSNLAQARARYEELYATYRSTVLSAIRDVEDNLTDLHHRTNQELAQARAVDAAREYLRLSDIQYRQGIIAYLQVIDADRTLLTNELAAAQISQQRQISTVLLFKSLGGGWQPASNSPATMPSASPREAPTPLPIFPTAHTQPAE